MDFNKLFNIPFPTLKQLAQEMDIPSTRSKQELIQKMTECFKEYEDYKTQTENKYKIIKQLGEKGKEGTTYLVSTPDGQEYAMKTFRKHKSPITLKQEAKLQKIAGKAGISPQVIDKDLVSKTIVMIKMDYHLIDVMKKQKGTLKQTQQKQIIEIFKKLDEIGIFHADANILNYMIKDGKIYMIDFGMSKIIDTGLIKKLGTSTPNLIIMTLGLVLKLKELGCPPESYKTFKKFISRENIEQFNL